MKRSSFVGICVAIALAGTQLADSVSAQSDGNSRMSVTVSFGVGLNTAQPGNAANHHVLPRVIEVKAGGVVNFVVAGFHQIFVYEPGKGVDDVEGPVAGSFFINDLEGLYYQGLAPAPPTTNPSNAINRVESVGFFEPGVYLVICNVRP